MDGKAGGVCRLWGGTGGQSVRQRRAGLQGWRRSRLRPAPTLPRAFVVCSDAPAAVRALTPA